MPRCREDASRSFVEVPFTLVICRGLALERAGEDLWQPCRRGLCDDRKIKPRGVTSCNIVSYKSSDNPKGVGHTAGRARALSLIFSRLGAAITQPAMVLATSASRRSLLRSAPGPLCLVPHTLTFDAFHLMDPTSCTFARAGCGSCCCIHSLASMVVVSVGTSWVALKILWK